MFGPDWVDRLADPAALRWSAVVVSPAVGSFLGVLIRRLPEARPVAWTRSCCEECAAALHRAILCRCSAG